MFEVPDYATCAVSSVSDLAPCQRTVAKMVTAMIVREADQEIDFSALGACNRHVELVEAHMAELGERLPITVSKAEFPYFMADIVRTADEIG